MSHSDVLRKESLLLASGRYDQRPVYAPQHGKQDGVEDQSELTLWFMKAELLMLTGFLKIRLVVNIHVKRDSDKVEPQHRHQLPQRLGRCLTWSLKG